MSTPSPLARALAEIRQLHAFFEDWFTGRLAPSAHGLARVADVLDPSFFLVTPAGERLGRTRLLRFLEAAHDSRPPEFRLEVRHAEARVVAADHVLAQYEELHSGDGPPTRRIASALFRPEPLAPNGVAWLFVHETWRDAGAADQAPALVTRLRP
ncbi:MAG: DUF4440 domain-containing protein [Planctomycetota bacterium]